MDETSDITQRKSTKVVDEPVKSESLPNMFTDNVEGETYHGGEKFIVPKTADTVQVFLSPKHINFGTLIAVTPAFFMLYLSFIVQVPIYVNICVFLFFRMCYNAGLGYLLDVQSKKNQLTVWYQHLKKNPDALLSKFVQKLIDGGLPEGKKASDYPDEFLAWLWFKAIVNISLVNDSTNYSWLAIRCFEIPNELTLKLVLQWSVAAVLFVFNIWAKNDAHRVLGLEYSWYWGDFFIRKNLHLTFDGIFELVPHPMYVAGYSVYYGICLFTRSYTILVVSLIAHVSQIVFLILVEEPHIQRTYGDCDAPPTRNEEVLYHPQTGLFQYKPSNYTVIPLNYKDVNFISSIVIGVLVALVSYNIASLLGLFLLVLGYRVAHWIGMIYILHHQSHSQSFTRMFQNQGKTVQQAFQYWQFLYSTSLVACNTGFFALVLRCTIEYYSLYESVFTMAFVAKLCVCIVLTLITIYSSISSVIAISPFGWFYGDFFIPKEIYVNPISYTGVYRFLNNPDLTLNYCCAYGFCLLSGGNYLTFTIVVVSHILNTIFVNFVEEEHMKRNYGKMTLDLPSGTVGCDGILTASQSFTSDSSSVGTDSNSNSTSIRKSGPINTRLSMVLSGKPGYAEVRQFKKMAAEKVKSAYDVLIKNN